MVLRFFLCVIGLIFIACSSNNNKGLVEDKLLINEDHFSKISIHITQQGKLKAVVFADSSVRKKPDYTAETIAEFYGNFKSVFYNKNGKQDMYILAKYCKYNEKTNYMFLKDSVYIETTKGDVIRAKNLTWNSSTERFTTEDSIDIKRPNERIRGVGFSGNSDLSNYQIYKTVGVTRTQSIEF